MEYHLQVVPSIGLELIALVARLNPATRGGIPHVPCAREIVTLGSEHVLDAAVELKGIKFQSLRGTSVAVDINPEI
jgi:hypothetical protein